MWDRVIARLDGSTRPHRNRGMGGQMGLHSDLPRRWLSKLPSIAVARLFLALAMVVIVLIAGPIRATDGAAESDLFREAVNYVFTGRIDPQDPPQIVDRESCVVLLRDPKYPRYIKYYMSRFKMDAANFNKSYAGSKVSYNLDVQGDNTLLEYLELDKTTVTQAYRSAQIPLPGNIDQTQKALKIIFADHCKADQTKTPF
jgi:hypothetical protein